MRAGLLLILLISASSLSAREVTAPSAAGAAQPFLTTAPDGKIWMSWIEPAGEGHAVRVAAYAGGEWTSPRTVVQRDDLFVNWADFPSVAVTKDGTLFVHWLQKSSAGKYSYDVHVASSRDGGKTWRTPRVVHRDRTPTEHGFVSMRPIRDDAVAVVWLDGRAMTGDHGGDMTLRYARIDARGALAREDLLDSRVCECCTTGMAVADAGPVIVYRDRSPDETRDISVIRWQRGAWTRPATIHADGWKIDGCPVNGPQVEARGNAVSVAWFTAADGVQKVLVAFSADGGARFAAPVRVDSGAPSGRVDLIQLEDGSAVVAWVEGLGEATHIALRRVFPGGRVGTIARVAGTSTARGSGFPRMTMAGKEIALAWTEPSTPRRVRVMMLPLPR